MSIETDDNGDPIEYEITYEPNDRDRLFRSTDGFYFRSRIQPIKQRGEVGGEPSVAFVGQVVVADETGEPILDSNGDIQRERQQHVAPLRVAKEYGWGTYKRPLRDGMCALLETYVAGLTDFDDEIDEL